jgi:hypothetical protein
MTATVMTVCLSIFISLKRLLVISRNKGRTMEQSVCDLSKQLGCKGLMCSGPHGLLLASSGDVRPDNSGFLSSLVSKAESIHRENRSPIVTIETVTTLVLLEPKPPYPPPLRARVCVLFEHLHLNLTKVLFVYSKIIITRKENVCVGIYQELPSPSW